MSTSRHPVALRVEERVGRGTRLLATVMALPLIDGVFPALVLAGALSTWLGVLQVGLVVFGGSATLAVVLAELDGPRREVIRSVLAVGAMVTAVAAVEAALAPTLTSVLDMDTFQRFAALVVLVVAARTASATVAEYLPGPAVVILLGLFASVDPAGADPTVVLNPDLVLAAAAAGAAGTALALAAAVAGPALRGVVDLDRFRFGSAVALGVLPLSVLELVPTDAPLPLAVLAVAALLAIDPRGEAEGWSRDSARADGGAGADANEEPEAGPADDDDAPADGAGDPVEKTDQDSGPERAPWL